MWSIWEKTTYENLDLLVVGGGFTGLWTAREFLTMRPGAKVLIVDDGRPASLKNAGFACFGSYTEIVRDMQENGKEKAFDLLQMRKNGLDKIRQDFGNQIDLHMHGGYELILQNQSVDLSMVDEVNEWLEPLAKDVFNLAGNKVKEFGFSGVREMLHNRCEGQLNPFLLWHALRQEIYVAGGMLTHTTVKNWEYEGTHFTIEDSTANRFQAKNLCICTNGFTHRLFPELEVQPGRGFVISTMPMEIPFSGTFHIEEGYYYFRDFQNRIILGGGRHLDFETEKTDQLGTNEKIINKLVELLIHTIIPGRQFQLEKSWAGIMGFGNTRYPQTGVRDGVHYAVGMGGMGVALAPEIGRKIATRIHHEF